MRILFIIIAFAISLSSHAQYFAPIGATWHYDQEWWSPPFSKDLVTFKVVGDTVTGTGDSVTTLRERKGSSISFLQLKFDSNRVYYYYPQASEFRLLYDFNAIPGDTLKVFCRQGGLDTLITIIIDSVSSIVVGGDTLKVQHISNVGFGWCLMDGPIIERIGCLGFMFPQSSFADPPYGGPLRCYEDSIIGLYKLSTYDCDYVNVSIEDANQDEHTLKLFPNPADDLIRIESTEKLERFEIRNLLGQLISRGKVNSSQIDISNIDPGIYFINLYNLDQRPYTRPLVKF